jgi:hypothetical protein
MYSVSKFYFGQILTHKAKGKIVSWTLCLRHMKCLQQILYLIIAYLIVALFLYYVVQYIWT